MQFDSFIGPLTNLWVSDVSYFDGLYQRYYAGSRFWANTSLVGLAINKTLDSTSPQNQRVGRGLFLGSTPTII